MESWHTNTALQSTSTDGNLNLHNCSNQWGLATPSISPDPLWSVPINLKYTLHGEIVSIERMTVQCCLMHMYVVVKYSCLFFYPNAMSMNRQTRLNALSHKTNIHSFSPSQNLNHNTALLITNIVTDTGRRDVMYLFATQSYINQDCILLLMQLWIFFFSIVNMIETKHWTFGKNGIRINWILLHNHHLCSFPSIHTAGQSAFFRPLRGSMISFFSK